MPTFKDYLIATRPWSFSMSVISVAMGTFVAWQEGPIHWGWFALVVAGMVATHAAGNVLNDYFDTKSHVDSPDSATAKYRPHPILSGMLTPRAVFAEAMALFGLAAVAGLLLAVFRTPHVLWIAAAGFVLTFFYSGWPLTLKYRALGEMAVFLIWGPLMFLGSYAVQTGTLSVRPLVASVPFGALVALVLFANNIRDIEHDGRTQIRTLGTLLGRDAALTAFSALMLSAYAYVVVLVALGVLSPWMLLVLLSLPPALRLTREFRRAVPDAADALTAKVDTLFGLLCVAALVLSSVVHL